MINCAVIDPCSTLLPICDCSLLDRSLLDRSMLDPRACRCKRGKRSPTLSLPLASASLNGSLSLVFFNVVQFTIFSVALF